MTETEPFRKCAVADCENAATADSGVCEEHLISLNVSADESQMVAAVEPSE